MIEDEIRDWHLNSLTGKQEGSPERARPDGETALVLLGPAGVGKTFTLTHAVKLIEKEIRATNRKAILTWDVMEVDRDTAEERLAFLENLIFGAKSRNRTLRFNNYAFALAAYARRRRPGLKAHESHPEFNRMRKAVLGLGGAAGGAMLELLNEIGLDKHFDAAIDLIEQYGDRPPEGFMSFARNVLGGLSGQGLDFAAQHVGEGAAEKAANTLERRRSEFRQRVRDLSERNGAVADPTKQLELLLPEAFALDCALNVEKGHDLKVLAIVDRAEAISAEQTLAWIEKLTKSPSAIRLMLGERIQSREEDRFLSRFTVQFPDAGSRIKVREFQNNPVGVRNVLFQHKVPEPLWPRVEERAEGRPIYAKLWSEIFHRNYERLGDVDKAADFYPTGQHIINYYLANMPESMRLQIELAAVVPSMPIDAFFAILNSENIGEGAARPEDVRAIGRATAPEGRIEIHEELRHALLDTASERRKRWLEGKQYQLALWALHKIAIPERNETREDRAAYLGLFEAAALSINADRLSKLAVLARAADFATIGGVSDVVDLLRGPALGRHRQRTQAWTRKLIEAGEQLAEAEALYPAPSEEEMGDADDLPSEQSDSVLVHWLARFARGQAEVQDRASFLALHYLSLNKILDQDPQLAALKKTVHRLIDCFHTLYPEFALRRESHKTAVVDLQKPHPVVGMNLYEAALGILDCPERSLRMAVLAKPCNESFLEKRYAILSPVSSDAEAFMARVFCPGKSKPTEPCSFAINATTFPFASPDDHLLVARRLDELKEDEVAMKSIATGFFNVDNHALYNGEPETVGRTILAGIEVLGLSDEEQIQAFVNVLADEVLWYRFVVHHMAQAWNDDDILAAAWRLKCVEDDDTAPVPFDGGPRHLQPELPSAMSYEQFRGYERAETLSGGPLLWSTRRLGTREGMARRAYLARFSDGRALHPHLKYLTGGYALDPKGFEQYNLTRTAKGQEQLIGYDETAEAFDARTRAGIAFTDILGDFLETGDTLWQAGSIHSSSNAASWIDHSRGILHEVWKDCIRGAWFEGKEHGHLVSFIQDDHADPYVAYPALEKVDSEFEIEIAVPVEAQEFDPRTSPSFVRTVRAAQMYDAYVHAALSRRRSTG
ncbi:hypothetical protein ILP92_17925 [Maribius pontilimi]|uniref:Uncharacterized protein n=1 Tax=Palleronia pontilimi TaxID=1964209 RepID=A0A934IL83_9RHOB|nr:hypothetical protein [Palleronia pontilimi]MBJ3764615.1 hypothetical protein [Palleronia pontilimi]